MNSIAHPDEVDDQGPEAYIGCYTQVPLSPAWKVLKVFNLHRCFEMFDGDSVCANTNTLCRDMMGVYIILALDRRTMGVKGLKLVIYLNLTNSGHFPTFPLMSTTLFCIIHCFITVFAT